MLAMTVGIVGLGLIGGSIGLALRDPNRRIIGYDPVAKSAEVAKSRFCVDEVGTLADVAKADVVFVAAPPDSVVSVLDQIASLRGESTVVTDCASIKEQIVEWANSTGATWFVPGHPMAGHEKSGAKYASAWLFRDARWILTPVTKTDRASVRAVEALVKIAGAKPIRLDAGEHDRHVAVLSHLPHVVANAISAVAQPLTHHEIGAGSWRDVTRVAGAEPVLWAQILGGNSIAVSAAIDSLIEELRTAQAALKDRDQLLTLLHEAREIKENQGKRLPTDSEA
jgi:prephenate dehydrogenase